MTSSVGIKPALTHQEMISLFKDRGMIIEDEEKAIEVLTRVSYYRFTGYDLTFKKDNKYAEGTTFEKIHRHYEFDKSLRLMLMELIEYIEISIRTQLTYMIAHDYPDLGYRDPNNFVNEEKHQRLLEILDNELNKSNELFVKHHRENRNGIFPVWVALEMATFSNLVELYKNLKTDDQIKLSSQYNLHNTVLKNWLIILKILRNRCAHHSRLFNSLIITKPKILRTDKHLDLQEHHLYTQIFNMKYLIKDHTLWNSWVTRLEALIEQYDDVDINRMGFKEKWSTLLKTV